MEKGKIIFLNGVTSSGKTSIVEAMQSYDDPFSMLWLMIYLKIRLVINIFRRITGSI